MIDFGVVTIGDKNFFPGVVAMVKSLNANSSIPIPVAVIDQGFAEKQLDLLKEMKVKILNPKRSIPYNSERFGSCYALFDIDSSPFENILYIDADILVLDDIAWMFELIRFGKVLSSSANPARYLAKKYRFSSIHPIVKNCNKDKQFFTQFRKEFGLPWNFFKILFYRSLNTGVVGINRNTLLQLKKSIYKYKNYISGFKYPDQNLFSLLLAENSIRCNILPYTCNATHIHRPPNEMTKKNSWIVLYYEHIDVDIDLHKGTATVIRNRIKGGLQFNNTRIKMLHFNSKDKPWHKDAIFREGFKELWEYYYHL